MGEGKENIPLCPFTTTWHEGLQLNATRMPVVDIICAERRNRESSLGECFCLHFTYWFISPYSYLKLVWILTFNVCIWTIKYTKKSREIFWKSEILSLHQLKEKHFHIWEKKKKDTIFSLYTYFKSFLDTGSCASAFLYCDGLLSCKSLYLFC